MTTTYLGLIGILAIGSLIILLVRIILKTIFGFLDSKHWDCSEEMYRAFDDYMNPE